MDGQPLLLRRLCQGWYFFFFLISYILTFFLSFTLYLLGNALCYAETLNHLPQQGRSDRLKRYLATADEDDEEDDILNVMPTADGSYLLVS